MRYWKASLTSITLLFSSYANSAVIQYDESINGDLSANNINLVSAAYLGSADVGENTVSGITSWDPSVSLSNDSDYFSFTIGAGNQLDSLFINYASTPLFLTEYRLKKLIGPNEFGGLDYETILGFYVGFDTVDEFGPGVPIIHLHNNFIASQTDVLSALNIGSVTEGQYTITMDPAFVGAEFSNQLSELNYTLNMNVSAVPVPAAVWLFLSGFISLVGVSRLKK